MSFEETYVTCYQTPTWCTGGLDPSTDFSTTPPNSLSGYANGTIRLYSPHACSLLRGIWHPNGECTSCSQGGETYNASLVCAGLNDNSNNPLQISLSSLSDECPPAKDTYKNLFWVIVIIFVILYGLKYSN